MKEQYGQFVGEGEYGRIYEGMELYDEYREENCVIEYLEEDFGFRLYYDNCIEYIEDLNGLQIVEKIQTKVKEDKQC